jgi:hypothetical protein
LRFEVGVGMVMSCAKTFDWLEPAILNSTIPKIGRIFVMENYNNFTEYRWKGEI